MGLSIGFGSDSARGNVFHDAITFVGNLLFRKLQFTIPQYKIVLIHTSFTVLELSPTLIDIRISAASSIYPSSVMYIR
jgi:hypothetical protein